MPDTREIQKIMQLQNLAGFEKFSKRTIAEELERSKLIELLQNFADGTYSSNGTICDGTKVDDVADHLIANGVTVQEWISVKDERKPKQLQECLCVCQFDDDPKGEWRFYNVLKWHDVPYQDNGIVNRPHFTDEGVHGMVVTHWMPLPKLPQPPKGE